VARDYSGITAYLADQGSNEVVLSFEQLDALVVGGLPPSARKHSAWWTNSLYSRPHSRIWIDARRNAHPDFVRGFVTFTFGGNNASVIFV